MKILLPTALVLMVSTKWTYSKSIEPSSSENTASLSFDIFHINDIHAHFDPMNAKNGRCRPDLEECYGGFPRLYNVIEDLRSKSDKSFFFNAGDYYQGTIWYSVFKYKAVMEFANMLNYTAMSLGNHEFDDDLSGIEPFVKGADFPVLACNIKVKSNNEYKFRKSFVDTSLGKKVGIIGYISTSTPIITNLNVGKVLEFTDEIECIRQEAQRLQKEEGVDILIALGHSGYEVDIEIAKEVEELDIVVGGHSHTFLYPKGDTPPLEDEINGDYPTYVNQASGRVVPVVQAFCFSKYLGQFKVNFNDNGELLEPVDGTGVSLAKVHLLDNEENQDILKLMETYRKNLTMYYEEVGKADLDLRGKFLQESNLGNLVADSMAYVGGSPGAIAFVNNGGLRSDIGKGEITLEDIITTLPFSNKLEKMTIKGKSIKQIFENIASKWGNNTYTTFLQVSSSLKLKFLLKKDNVGSRLTNASIKSESTEEWSEMEDETIYDIILPSFLADGGFDGPNFAELAISRKDIEKLDNEALLEYIKEFSPINTKVEGRINVIDKMDGSSKRLESSFFKSFYGVVILLLLKVMF
ncbi:protein 5NUC [Lepeophtheirus salmonis]|uniref:protein 5NUC n=1 Tax=Lepeophtheirus salmonis TaxID=72036 RepID=UPI001AE8C61B|nr:protein 5NUC-like [Lepeophtheirus salmonis]